jgi:hypothetical protein
MTSLRQMAWLLAAAILLSLMSLMVLPESGDVLAQGTVLPTPTNVGEGGGGGGGGEGKEGKGGRQELPPGPPGALVSGFVYDYSKATRQSGITVMIEGGGWQAQTVSDSNGYYQFANLGAGEGVLNLSLPPGAHPVAPNWPVSFGSGADVRVNLGYYWGDDSPVPVRLSSNLKDSTLTVQVANRAGETATGGVVDILLPLDVKASPVVQASQGAVDYSERRLRVAVGAISAETQVTVEIPLEPVGTTSFNSRGPGQAVPLSQPPSAPIRVLFTYDQQATPQLIAVDLEQVAPAPVQTLMPVTGKGLSTRSLVTLSLPILLVLGLGAAGWWALKVKPYDRGE